MSANTFNPSALANKKGWTRLGFADGLFVCVIITGTLPERVLISSAAKLQGMGLFLFGFCLFTRLG